MKSVVGSKGTTMPMRPIPTSTSPSSSQTVRTARPRCTRPPGEGSAKTRIDMRLHAGEGRDRTIDHTALLSLIKRSEEHTSELQSLMRISYAVFCLKKKHKR